MSMTETPVTACPICGCMSFTAAVEGMCIHCKTDPLHMAWHRQEMYEGQTHGWVQWKGTKVCMDFYCVKCGYQDHIDADFVYYIHCLGCDTIYEVNGHVQMVELTETEYHAALASSSGSIHQLNDPEDDEEEEVS